MTRRRYRRGMKPRPCLGSTRVRSREMKQSWKFRPRKYFILDDGAPSFELLTTTVPGTFARSLLARSSPPCPRLFMRTYTPRLVFAVSMSMLSHRHPSYRGSNGIRLCHSAAQDDPSGVVCQFLGGYSSQQVTTLLLTYPREP